jgi:hypothetical protein
MVGAVLLPLDLQRMKFDGYGTVTMDFTAQGNGESKYCRLRELCRGSKKQVNRHGGNTPKKAMVL